MDLVASFVLTSTQDDPEGQTPASAEQSWTRGKTKAFLLIKVYFLLHGLHVLPVDLQHNIQWLYKYNQV